MTSKHCDFWILQVRDEVVKDRGDVQRRLDVLTEFFNKKEAELQRQLGLQSAKFGDVSSDAESAARQLVSVTSELDMTKDQVKIIKTELEDQERSLKASVAAQEKKAHENWVAATQAERKLTELQVSKTYNSFYNSKLGNKLEKYCNGGRKPF